MHPDAPRSTLILLFLLAIASYPRASAQSEETSKLHLSGEFLIPPGSRFPAAGPSTFGAISGLATLPGGCELLALSDDDVDRRFYRLRVSREGQRLRVTPTQRILLQQASDVPLAVDPEGIALTRTGTVLISSEGKGNVQPRLPPAILEYAQDGRFIRQLPVPLVFVPNQRGPQTNGVRNNGGFESLTVTSDFSRLFTANEIPLAQDGAADAFAAGQRIRLVEYASERGGYQPVRQFAYELSPLDRPKSGVGLSINGVSELLAVSDTELLALERGFIQARGSKLGLNRIRLYRLSLDGATDVSSIDSLAGREDIKPVRKTLIQDFSRLSGLSLRLFNLENFEGLAWVGPDHGSLLAVSDDNFNSFQVTAFLLLDLGAPPPAPACP
jgi:3-phytase